MNTFSAEKLSESIKSLRKSKHLTQMQLAKLTGINCTVIGRIENGSYIPTIVQLERLAASFGFDQFHFL